MSAIDDLTRPAGGIDRQIYLAGKEIITAANKAGHTVRSCSWYNPASTPEHNIPGFQGGKGCAVDFMVYKDKAAGDWLADYIWRHRARLGVCWIIWYRRIRSTSPGRSGNWTKYTGPSAHYDHVHVNFGHLVGKSGYGNVSKISYKSNAPSKPDPDIRKQPMIRTCKVEDLHSGVKNNDSVWWVQKWMNYVPLPNSPVLKLDGDYESQTISAVKEFQRLYSLKGDGNLGPKETVKLYQMAKRRKKDLPGVAIQHKGKKIN